MIDYAKTLLEVAIGTLGLRADFGRSRRERRERLATYFSKLATLIEAASASLRINKYPHGICAQLETRARLMKKTLKGIVPDQEAQAFQDKLLQVHAIERQFDKLQSMTASRAKTELSRLDEAAGYSWAVAAHLKLLK